MVLGLKRKHFLTVVSVLSVVIFLQILVSEFTSRQHVRNGFSGTNNEDNNKNLTIFVLGDIGGIGRKPYTTRTQRLVAKTMEKQAVLHNVSTIVALGDNIYPHGVKNVNDPRFKATFEDVYSSPGLLRAQWLMVAGNHDYEGNVGAQLEYSKKSKRWHFPSLYYSKVFRISKNVYLQMVVIDTHLLCTSSKYSKSSLSRMEHRKWLNQTLRMSKATFLIVAGHNPIISAGVHGGSKCLVGFLKPLLEQYRVTAYMSGHDHNFQHIKEDGKDVDYFVSGNGNYHDSGDKQKINSLHKILKKFYGFKGGFTKIGASSSKLQVTHVDCHGNDIYSTDIKPRRVSVV